MQVKERTEEIAKKVIEAIEYATGEEPRKYSGRGMYGRECVGYTTDDILSSIVEIAEVIFEEMDGNDDQESYDFLLNTIDALKGASYDNMGLEMIVYFPRLPWPSDVESRDEDEE